MAGADRGRYAGARAGAALRSSDAGPDGGSRETGRADVSEALAADPARTLVRLTPLVLRLGSREQGVWARDRFEAALRAADPVLAPWWRPARPARWGLPGRRARTLTGEEPDTVLAWLRGSGDLPTRRFAVRITIDTGRCGVRELAGRAAAERDPASARLWADAALAAMAADGPDDEAVDLLLGGHVPMVRAGGVTALRRAGRAAEAADHLGDRSGLVRACARWLLRQDGGDPPARYRELVADPARVGPYAVAGLSECGGREDVPALRALLDHREDAVRAAALAGLRRLDALLEDALLLGLLVDPSPSVAREASLSLRAAAGRLDPVRLGALVAAGRPVHVRRAAFRLLRARGGIRGLRASVRLLADADPALRRLAEAAVRGWDWQWTLHGGAEHPGRTGRPAPAVGVPLPRPGAGAAPQPPGAQGLTLPHTPPNAPSSPRPPRSPVTATSTCPPGAVREASS